MSDLLRAHRIFATPYHRSTYGETERVNHTMAQRRAAATNQRQAEMGLSFSSSPTGEVQQLGNAARGLVPNKVHVVGRMPRLYCH